MTATRDELLERAVAAFEREGATAVHLFGSLARGDDDALSDIDLWMTVPDDKIEQLAERRFEIFNGISEVVIHYEAPRNRPLGGSYMLVIHRVDEALIQADYYLAPESMSVILPEAVQLSGSTALRRGSWVLDADADATEDLHERIDFLICMSFIGIKKALRGDSDFFAFLDREYERFQTTYDVDVDSIDPTGGLNSLAASLRSLLRRADKRQSAAIQSVLADVPRQVRLHAEHSDAPA